MNNLKIKIIFTIIIGMILFNSINSRKCGNDNCTGNTTCIIHYASMNPFFMQAFDNSTDRPDYIG
jgi:hypothetical protein